MKVMVTGSGGREHALAWKIAQSERVSEVIVAPGNAGTASEPKLRNVAIDVLDFDALIEFAKQESIDVTVIGPEDPLVHGVVDQFIAAGLRCFGPDQMAAQLEGSKSFTKEFLAKYNIPTAAYGSFEDLEEAIQYLDSMQPPYVIKADGLAAGKGVVIASNRDEAVQTLTDMLSGNVLSGAGSRVVIEEFLKGEEASFIVIANGLDFVPFASSQDHKAAYDGDKGPNTGGMGAYSPAPVVTSDVHDRIVNEVIKPTLAGMAAEGCPYTGFLYAGLMIDSSGAPKVIEFNCRFGDPETQPIMCRLQTDLIELIDAALIGHLSDSQIQFDDQVALTVVVASGGYPGNYEKGVAISGLAAAEATGAKVFHAGTSMDADQVVTSGGRVLGVTAVGPTVADAQARAYAAVSEIEFANMMLRTDIGYRAVEREAAN